MEEEFGIQIEDGSHVMPQFAVEQNSSSIQLHDWQRKAIKFFFDSCHVALYEVTTGAGKTYCAIEILKEIWKFDPEAKFLIVVPKNVILERGWYTELYDAGIHIPEIGTYYGAFKEY